MSPASTKAWAVLALSDGRAGNVAQALGLAEAVMRAAPRATLRAETLTLRALAAAAPPRLADGALRAIGSGALRAAATRGGDVLEGPTPDLVIGAGRRVAPVVAAFKRRGARAVQILDPKMPVSRFDLLVAPAHDGLSGPTVVSTLGSVHRAHPRLLGETARDRRFPSRRPLFAALIGGPSKSAVFSEADINGLCDVLERLAGAGAGIAATVSRRTPERAAARLVALAERSSGVFVWRGEGENPYFALLAHADAIIATADSVNMASEAAATGAPLFIAPVTRLSAKLERFQGALREVGAARPLPEAALTEAGATALVAEVAATRRGPGLDPWSEPVRRILAL